MTWHTTVFMVLLIGVCASQSYVLVILYEQQVETEKVLTVFVEVARREPLYDKALTDMSIRNGVYYHDQYYCVWTEGQSVEEIGRTDCHEVCHALIGQGGWQHFCGED